MVQNPIPLDGVSAPSADAPQQAPKPAPPEPAVRRWKGLLIAAFVAAYVVYGAWSVAMVSLFPSADRAVQPLLPIALIVAASAAFLFVAVGAVMIQRISLSHADTRQRVVALAKVVFAVLPALIISVVVPLSVTRSLPIVMDITSPASAKDMIAPVSMTFSVEKALPGLAVGGFVPVEYRWDVNGDRKTDQETSVPELTATFEREGSYTVAVVMLNAAGMQKSTTKRFAISQSVFKITPPVPIVNQTAIFSLAHLYPQEGTVKEVRWDFNDDGVVDATTASLEVTHTFFQLGSVKVKADVALQNNTSTSFERTVAVIDPPALPFPVTLTTEPKTLIGSPPFPVLFSLTSGIVPAKVEWDFGDGDTAEGMKTAHTFEKKGIFPVTAKAYSSSGVIANLQTTVRMVDVLRLPDLIFEGTPAVTGNRIEGEVPVSLNLTPKTATPFIEFDWEAPDATEIGTTDTSLQAIYRREGTYAVTLIGQDLEDHVLRLPITVVVKPPTESLVIAMDPETGVAPLDVKFDASESFVPGETITGFVWNFGDDSKEEFGGARAEHSFASEGTYSIGLTVKTTSGKTFSTKKTLVVREPLLRACITPSRIKGSAPMGVDFSSDCSVGQAKTYLWDFGDGTQSDLKKVIHVFDKPGAYTVKLTVSDGSATHTSSVLITAQ